MMESEGHRAISVNGLRARIPAEVAAGGRLRDVREDLHRQDGGHDHAVRGGPVRERSRVSQIEVEIPVAEEGSGAKLLEGPGGFSTAAPALR